MGNILKFYCDMVFNFVTDSFSFVEVLLFQ